MIKRIIDYIVWIIVFAFLLEMTTILFWVFINPDLRFSIGEPNRLISSVEFVLGWVAISWLLIRTLERK